MCLDTKAFRRALSQFATGVCVITTIDAEGEPVGVTASSFNSVSMDPPLILWSVDKAAFSAGVFEKSAHFCVNVLGTQQSALSNRFASRGTDKFSSIPYTKGVGDCPVLENTVASFQCSTWKVYEGGDHHIMVGKVEEFSCSEGADGLVFHRGQYAMSVAQPQPTLPVVDGETSGFVDNYLLYLLRQIYSRYSQDFYPKLADFGISAQEWRIVTILSDATVRIDDLMPLVGQPLHDLVLTCELLQSKKLISIKAEYLALTETGTSLCQQLVTMANQHEATILAKAFAQSGSENDDTQSHDSAAAAQQLKEQLKAVLQIL